MFRRITVPALICSALMTTTAYSHHGFAVHYDVNEQIRIDGRVHEILLRNPHSVVKVSVANANGDDDIWTCETQAGSILKRKGITADRFAVGQRIVIAGSQARRNPHGCEIGSIQFADGDSVTLRSVQGHARIDVNNVSADSAKESRSVFGSWLRDSFSGPPMTPGFLDKITAAGRAANTGYVGSRDDPTNNCSPVNPIRAWIAPGTPTEIREVDGRIEIQHEFMDTTRIVHMDSGELPANIEASDMGYSVGRFDGDSLIIDTAHFEAGVMLTHVGESGVLHTEELRMTEIISVVPDTGELRIQWEASDAQYFPQSITGQLILSPTALTIDTFDCVPRSAY